VICAVLGVHSKSYPTIMIPKKEYYLESNKIIQKFSFTNKGELSAFNLSVLVINTFKGKIRRKPNDLIFRENLGAFYSIDKDSLASDKITSIDFETKLPKDLSYNLTSREPIKTPIPFRANHPIHALVIIRFKVPYGNYCYETYSFVLKEEKTWQRMSDSDTYDLLKKYFRKVKNEKALKFLSHNEQLFRYQTKDIWKR
jgi:hypothetical protein